MQLTEHMRNHLLQGVIDAQTQNNPLLEGIDLNRLRSTLERDLTEEELASLMIAVGMDTAESMRALSLSILDRKIANMPTRHEDPGVPEIAPVKYRKASHPDDGGPLHRAHVHSRPWKTLLRTRVH